MRYQKSINQQTIKMNSVKEIKQCSVKGCCFNAIVFINFVKDDDTFFLCKRCANNLFLKKGCDIKETKQEVLN